MAFVLSDGRRIAVRPLRPSDRKHLVHGLGRLGERTRRLRFHGDRTRFSEAELDYLMACDGVDRIAEVAVGLDDAGEEFEGVAVARAYRDARHPGTAEVAIVVVDAWQGLGVGRCLLTALRTRCRAAGIERWTAEVLGENACAARLFESFGSVVARRWEGGVQAITVLLEADASGGEA